MNEMLAKGGREGKKKTVGKQARTQTGGKVDLKARGETKSVRQT